MSRWCVKSVVLLLDICVSASSLQEHNAQPFHESDLKLRIQHMARTPEGFRLQYSGATEDVTVRTPTQFALAQYMKVRLLYTHSSSELLPTVAIAA